MKQICTLLVMSILLLACERIEQLPEEEYASVCEWKKVTDTPWLNDWIAGNQEAKQAGFCYVSTISQGMYQGQSVIVVEIGPGALCCTCGYTTVYNCAGDQLFGCNDQEVDKITRKKLLWRD